MSDYQGNIVIKNPATPTGPNADGRAPGMWKLSEVAYWIKQGVWPNANILPDAYFPYVSLLLSTTSLGNANNNLFVDSSGTFSPVSRNGNAMQGAFSPYSTNWSNYFDGTGDEVLASNTPANFGSNNFTAECWVMFTTNTIGYQLVMGNQGAGDQQGGWIIYTESNNRIYFAYSTNGSSWGGFIDTGVTPTVGVWTHLAVVRSGSTFTFYVNGVASGTPSTNSSAIADPSGNFRIGRYPYFPGGARTITAWISNVRLVNGTAVYTANFTPPTSPLTAITNTSLLTCQSNRFRDASANNYAITFSGNPSVQEFGPFSPGSPGITYNQSDITNWSGFFNGGTDRVQVPVTSNMYLGTTYTIEAWAYYNSTSYGARPIFSECEAFQGGFAGLTLTLNTSGNLVAEYRPATSGAVTTITGPTVTPYTWFHIALVSDNSSAKLYVNGTQVGSTTTFGDYPSAKTAFVAVGSWGHGWNDGGIPAAAWIGYISNMRVVKGVAVYTSNFTPSTTPLTAVSGTVLLTCQNAAFSDNSSVNNILTPVSGATVTGNSPFNTVGYWSNYFDGSGDYERISSSQTALQFGTGDFTVEGWVYSTGGTGTYQHILTGGSSWASGSGGVFWYYNGGAPTLGCAWNQVTPNPAIQSSTLAVNTWHHFAVVRSGNTLTLYINGTSAGTLSVTGISLAVNNQSQTNIGGGGWDQDFTGYLSNLRVVKGTAVYTSNFTVPTTPLTAIANTSLLVCQSSRFIDSSTNAFTLVPAGNVAVQSFDPFYTSTIASNGGSMYFDGNGDYLTLPYSGNMRFPGNFTVECWVYPVSRLQLYPCIVSNYSTFTSNGSLGIFAGHNSSSSTKYQVAFNGSFPFMQSTSDIIYGAWAHIALVRVGSTITLFINGVANATGTSSATVVGTANNWWIGTTGDALTNGAFNGYVSSLRAVPSAVYTANFTPPTAPLTPTASTAILLNGMNAGIYDATAINDMETVGNAQVRYFIGNYYAGSFDGTGDYLSTATSGAIALGTSDFTFECWVNPTAYPNDATLVYAGNTSTGNEISLQIRNGQVASHLYISGSHSDVQFTDLPVSLNTWSHLAISRVSGVLYGFLNGVRSSVTTALTANFGSSAAAYVAVGDRFAGSLSNARMTKNVAIYSTATYTVPTSPLSATSNTAFLTCQNTTFTDNSPNALAITVNGGATAGVTGPFTYTRGNSMYFDGSGDCLSIPATPNLTFGTGDFTMEMWVYSGANGTSTRTMGNGAGASWSANKWVLGTGDATYVNKFIFGCNNANSGAALLYSTTAFNNNTWNYVAITRSGSTWRLFVNGVIEGTATSSASLDGGVPATITVGRSGISSDADWAGYIDDLRLTKGVARYTSNFTPPTQPFPVY